MSNNKAIAFKHQQQITALLITLGISTIPSCFLSNVAIAQQANQAESQSILKTANVNEVKTFIYS